MNYIMYFFYVHLILYFPGYLILSLLRFRFAKFEKLVLSYFVSILVFALGIVLWLSFPFSLFTFRVTIWATILLSVHVFFKNKLLRNFKFNEYQLLFMLFTAFSLIYISFPLNNKTLIPDPSPLSNRNYNVFNVKILNLAHTVANDNYVPFRQAQFMINRLDFGEESFISEWGVNFFFRTPLAGAVSSFILIVSGDKLPAGYLWADNNYTFDNVYIKYQIILHVLNSLFLLSSFLLLKSLFHIRIARLTFLILMISPFFLYNTFFSWPKSFVAYFVLLAWYYLIKGKNLVLSSLLFGISYWAHDLTIVYFLGSLFYLLFNRKSIITIMKYLGVMLLIIFPWFYISKIVYNQSSLFLYYPFSLYGIPQNKEIVFGEFFSTPIVDILIIKLKSAYFLMVPFHLFHRYSQGLLHVLWVESRLSIPGSVGLSLSLFSYLGLILYFKKYRNIIFSLVLLPILILILMIGWPFEQGGMASLHFSQSIVVVLTAIAIKLIVKIHNNHLGLCVFCSIVINATIVNLYNYYFDFSGWLTNTLTYFKLTFLVLYTLVLVRKIYKTYME